MWNRFVNTFFASTDLRKQSQEVLHQQLEKLEHLDLTAKLSRWDEILQRAHGGNGDVYTAYCWIGKIKVKVALKRLRFYIYKDKDLARVCLMEILVFRAAANCTNLSYTYDSFLQRR